MPGLIDDLSKLPQSERRRHIFMKSATKFRELGTPIDENAKFMELIDRWIAGEFEMRRTLPCEDRPSHIFISETVSGVIAQSANHLPINPPPLRDDQLMSVAEDDLSRVIDELALAVSRDTGPSAR
jgi:hypothetical protein